MKKILSTLFLLVVFAQANAYESIISTSGSYSEIIALLGAENKLVGVDTTSLIPMETMKDITKIGYRRNLSAEGILSLNADVILLAPDSGPPSVINQLMQANANMLNLSDDKTPQGVIENVLYLANELNVNEKGRAVVNDINRKLTDVSKTIKNYPFKPRIAFIMSMGDGRLIGLGGKSSGNSMLKEIGAINVFENDFDNTKAVSIESLFAKQADIILFANRDSRNFNDSIIKTSEEPSIKAYADINQSSCSFDVDIMTSLGWGPSFATAAKEISDEVYQCISP